MDTLETILKTKIIAISRGFYGRKLIDASLALYEGGVRAFEVTFEQDNDLVRSSENVARTCEAISALRFALPADAVIGAGTVITADQVNAAKDAGAAFIISPNSDPDVIKQTKHLGLVSIPGAMTPSEIVYARSSGADIVKVFPAGVLGVGYFKAIKTPLAHIRLAAVAGVDPDNISAFAKAGAEAFGVSTGLYVPTAVENGDFEALTIRARLYFDKLSVN